MTVTGARPLAADAALRQRAAAVIPGGMYGHQSAAGLPAGFPQFMARGRGARVWDADGNEYVDLMCSYGPVILGHRHPAVEAAARAQQEQADCQNAPSARMVELAEALTATVAHADWAMFAKNGTDATTLALMIARAATGRRTILAARGAYHGAAPWCTPRPAGTTPGDRAHLAYFTYTAWRAPRPRRPRPAATWQASSSAPSGTTPGSTRSSRTRRSPAACAPCATGPAPRSSWMTCAAASGCTSAAAGSRWGWTRT